MKKVVFLTTFILLIVLTGMAQQRGPREKITPQEQATRMVEGLNQELKLTEKQQKDLQIYFTDSFKKRNEAFEKKKEDRQLMRQEMRKIREATEAHLKKVLTAEQYKIYKANEEKRLQERQKKGRQPQGKERQGGGYPRQ